MDSVRCACGSVGAKVNLDSFYPDIIPTSGGMMHKAVFGTLLYAPMAMTGTDNVCGFRNGKQLRSEYTKSGTLQHFGIKCFCDECRPWEFISLFRRLWARMSEVIEVETDDPAAWHFNQHYVGKATENTINI